ncbi:MAG: metallophosphoesterase [Allosphingosinicella sp.]
MFGKMLRRLLGRNGNKGPSGPAHSRAYAIGDIHGRLDLLTDLLDQIERDNAARPTARTYLIFLGDFVDRGPDSRGVIERLLSHPPDFARPVFIKGNHEEFFLGVLNGQEETIRDWLTYGGYQCCESYGLSQGWTLNATAQEIQERLRAAVPESHRDFLENMADSFQFGDYVFVHAGIRPGVPLEAQSSKDLRWIREGFLDDVTNHGVMVVHGHTIVGSPEQHPNRISLDTGAYRSGVLTALGLEGRDRWFLTARDSAAGSG